MFSICCEKLENHALSKIIESFHKQIKQKDWLKAAKKLNGSHHAITISSLKMKSTNQIPNGNRSSNEKPNDVPPDLIQSLHQEESAFSIKDFFVIFDLVEFADVVSWIKQFIDSIFRNIVNFFSRETSTMGCYYKSYGITSHQSQMTTFLNRTLGVQPIVLNMRYRMFKIDSGNPTTEKSNLTFSKGMESEQQQQGHQFKITDHERKLLDNSSDPIDFLHQLKSAFPIKNFFVISDHDVVGNVVSWTKRMIGSIYVEGNYLQSKVSNLAVAAGTIDRIYITTKGLGCIISFWKYIVNNLIPRKVFETRVSMHAGDIGTGKNQVAKTFLNRDVLLGKLKIEESADLLVGSNVFVKNSTFIIDVGWYEG